jgi:hypothetical protein
MALGFLGAGVYVSIYWGHFAYFIVAVFGVAISVIPFTVFIYCYAIQNYF